MRAVGGGRVREVHEPLGDAPADLVLADDGDVGALEHLGGARRARAWPAEWARASLPCHTWRRLVIGANGVGADDPVGGKPGVALELARGALGEGAEDAVDRAAREAERVERLLQHGHVVPVEVRQAQVEHPVAEGEARIDERRPRSVADDPVLGETRAEPETREPPASVAPRNTPSTPVRPRS